MNHQLKIKVCGMRDEENIREVSQLDIDYMGFIFYAKSPRYVQMISSQSGTTPDYSRERLERQMGKQETANVSGRLKRVGVFVDEMPQTIITRVYNYQLDFVQLHGNESPTMIENLKRTLIPDIAPNIKIIKAISVSKAEDVGRYCDYEGLVDLFLFDTKCPIYGGSGSQFDWSVLDAYDGATPFLLSGGIGPDDVGRIRQFSHPRCIGVDVNSKFETEPGVKDVARLRTFVEALRNPA
jgi:phosphoribosylanthranilate isomerase